MDGRGQWTKQKSVVVLKLAPLQWAYMTRYIAFLSPKLNFNQRPSKILQCKQLKVAFSVDIKTKKSTCIIHIRFLPPKALCRMTVAEE